MGFILQTCPSTSQFSYSLDILHIQCGAATQTKPSRNCLTEMRNHEDDDFKGMSKSNRFAEMYWREQISASQLLKLIIYIHEVKVW